MKKLIPFLLIMTAFTTRSTTRSFVDAPTTQASNIIIETPSGGGSVGYCYTAGNGQYRVILANPYHSINEYPVDGDWIYEDGGTNYGFGSSLGNGTYIVEIDYDYKEGSQICSWVNYVPQFPLYIKILEFNISEGDPTEVKYLTASALNNPAVLN